MMLDENLDTMNRRVAEMELVIREKDSLIETLKNWILSQKKELDNISADISIRNLELEEAQLDKLKEAKGEIWELKD